MPNIHRANAFYPYFYRNLYKNYIAEALRFDSSESFLSVSYKISELLKYTRRNEDELLNNLKLIVLAKKTCELSLSELIDSLKENLSQTPQCPNCAREKFKLIFSI